MLLACKFTCVCFKLETFFEQDLCWIQQVKAFQELAYSQREDRNWKSLVCFQLYVKLLECL